MIVYKQIDGNLSNYLPKRGKFSHNLPKKGEI